MVSSNGDARSAIRGWLQDNVTGGRDVPNDEPLIDNGVMTSLQTVELVVFLEDDVRYRRRGRGVRRRELRVRRRHRQSRGEQSGVRSRPEFTLHDLLYNSVARDPQKTAVVDGDTKYTYEDLERQSSSLGAALAEAGVGRGDRVGVYLEKSWEAIVAMLAASRIGAAYVNVNPLFKAPQVEYLRRRL